MLTFNKEQWQILFVEPSSKFLIKPNGTYAIGACDDRTKTIYLNNTLTGRYLKRVLCHEITHAALFSYNITMSLQQEELIANIMSIFGAEIIKVTNIVFNQLKKKGRF